MTTIKAKGQRGSWFAKAGGESLPCVHACWFKGGSYHDPNARPGDRKWDELIAALQEKRRVILTTGEVFEDGMRFDRTGYVAVYAIDNLSLEGSDLRFRFVERLHELV